jgi:hypothetical protein
MEFLQQLITTLLLVVLGLMIFVMVDVIRVVRDIDTGYKMIAKARKNPDLQNYNVEDMEPGVYYPTEDETLEMLNEMGENVSRAVANPYRAWGIYEEEE